MILALTIFATFCLVTVHRYLGQLMFYNDPAKGEGEIFFATTFWFAAPITMLWVLYARLP